MGEAVHAVSQDSVATDVLEKLIEDDLGYALVVDSEKCYVGTERLQRINSAVRWGVSLNASARPRVSLRVEGI